MPREIDQYGQDILAPDLSLDMDRRALAAVLVDHRQHAESLAVMGELRDEAIAPDMTTTARPWGAGTRDPSFSHRRPHFGCRCGTFSHSRRQMRLTRLAFTVQPSSRSKAVMRRQP